MDEHCDGLNGIFCEQCGGGIDASEQCDRPIICHRTEHEYPEVVEMSENSQKKRTRIASKTLTHREA